MFIIDTRHQKWFLVYERGHSVSGVHGSIWKMLIITMNPNHLFGEIKCDLEDRISRVHIKIKKSQMGYLQKKKKKEIKEMEKSFI